KRKRLHRVEFLPASDAQAFGFLNPDEIIRGSHLIPAFAHGRTEELLAHDSIGRLPRDGLTKLQDWRYYYVNFFVDRDMYIRYRGGGVGHYRVHIPPEDDVPLADGEEDDTPVAAEDPVVVDVITPPRTPDIDDVPLPPERPASSLSVNSTSSGSSGHSGSTGAGSNVGSGDELDDGDFGPDDGDGDFEEEVEEGYAPFTYPGDMSLGCENVKGTVQHQLFQSAELELGPFERGTISQYRRRGYSGLKSK
ncbi:hypothetical protein K438DRAFT_2128296, partial [Mycena galopus ATCC 62051]